MSLPADDPSHAARAEFLALMHGREARPCHVQHVSRLSLALFDGLAPLHHFGPRERLLLEAAAHLHDIGHSSPEAAEGHHKESARLIREHAWAGFSPREVEIIAQVARYHRRALPEFSHDEFRNLPAEDRDLVLTLAAILRLADALDRTHAQLVQNIAVGLPNNRIVLRLEASDVIDRELISARQKCDLAILVFQRDVEFAG